ncbi:MAG: mechanosensitive ion channel [Cyanobacteria bacterium]|nr:mechanosensitive ion channel [Cyanobacteriota bacterium]
MNAVLVVRPPFRPLEPVWRRDHRRPRWTWGWAVGAFLLAVWLGLSAAPAGALAAAPPPTQKVVLQAASPGDRPVARSSSSPQWITLDGRRILELRSVAGAQSLESVANRGSALLQDLARKATVAPEQLVVQEDPPYSMIGVIDAKGIFKPFLAVDDRAGRAFEISRQELAELYRDQLRGAMRQYRSTHSLSSWITGTAMALLVLGAYLLWLRLQGEFNQRLRQGILRGTTPWLRGVSLAGSQVLDSEQERGAVLLLLRVLHWGVLLLASYLMIPLLLGFFPPTQGIAEGLRGHIRLVLDGVLEGAVAAIPNLLAIALILLFTRMAMRACRTWFAAIERGRLQFPGFYREWARPTGRLVAAAILVAGLVSAYPYIPGSDSKAFQGAGLFVGVLAALGSSAVATNVISGLMLIYTRAFREGDRVEINDVIGVVQDRDLLVTRIQTPRNELVSIPNATVISASIVNFSFSRREIAKPVALATTITIGYDVPWRQVHALLLKAAQSVPGIAADPQAFVLQISLNDFNISYELNASVRDVMTYRETLSDLLAAIQDVFAEADVEILSPTYECNRDGSARTVPPLPSLDSLKNRPN